jgi:hypothetical protein
MKIWNGFLNKKNHYLFIRQFIKRCFHNLDTCNIFQYALTKCNIPCIVQSASKLSAFTDSRNTFLVSLYLFKVA